MNLIDGKWFDCNNLLHYGLNLNIVNGKRDIGKSYGQLLRAHARRLRNHEGMLWLRLIADDADKLAGEFASGKWLEIWERYGQTRKNFMRRGNRIFWREKEGAEWLPLIRFAGLSEWHKLRDRDDPQEKFIFFDEYIVPPDRLSRYRSPNPPAQDLLDLWLSMRRGKTRCPILCAGNPELGPDWLSPYILRDRDRRTPERVRVYDTKESVREYCRDSDGVYNMEKIAILWTENPTGHHSGGSASGRAQSLPAGLLRARSGSERLYTQLDIGSGFVSLWYARGGGLIVDTVRTPEKVIRLSPDGSALTTVLTPYRKRGFGILRLAWTMGQIWYTNADAYRIFMSDVKKIL